MKSERINLVLILTAVWLLGGCSWMRGNVSDLDDQPIEQNETGSTAEQVIEPEVERRDITVPKIDNENWEVGAYAGVISYEDFGSQLVYGVRGAYHVTEDFFLELNYGQSEISDENFRNFGLAIFPDEDEDVTFYNFSLGYNFLPGEVFVGTKWAMTSSMYFVFGAGNTEFIDEDELTYILGFGLKVIPKDFLTLRLEARDNIFESDLLGDNEFKHNMELNFGIAFIF